MISRYVLTGALSTFIVACSSTPGVISDAKREIAHNQRQAEQTMTAKQQFSPSSTSIVMTDDLWVGGHAIQLSDRDVLPDFFQRPTTFYQLDPVSFQEIVSRLTAEFGTRIVLSPDAIEHLRSLSDERDEESDQNLQTNLPSTDDLSVSTLIDTAGQGLVGSKVRFTLQHAGTVASLLDLVTNKANLFWRWDKTHITIYRHVTKTFVIDSLPGKSTFEASVKTNSTNGNSSHSTGLSAAPESHWESLVEAVGAMVSSSGRFALSEQIGTLTVTDTPPVMDEVESYVKTLNGMLDRKIAIRTEVYEVLLEKDGNLGINWDLIFSGSSNVGVEFITGTADLNSNNGLGINVIRDNGFNGSAGLIGALSQFTDLSLVTSSSVSTTNGQPVPVQVVDETTYVASMQRETSEEGGRSEISLTPGVVTSGISMSLLPRVESDGDIMMQIAMDLSQLNEITTFGTEDAQIQLPRRSSKNFLQRVSLRSGETLMVSGFERTETTNGTDSLAGKGLWFLGGKTSGGKRKVMTLILITPYLMAR